MHIRIMFRRQPVAFAVLVLFSSAAWAADNAADTANIANIDVHAERLKQEQGYQAQRTAIAGVDMSLLDIPYGVNVVTQQQLEDKQPQTLEEAVGGISGLHQGNNLAGTLDAIVKRGYGGNRDHSIMRNGMEMTQARNYTATAERVEVLKGPASVLYGVQDPGGIINIVSKKPQYDQAAYTLSAGIGSRHAKQWGLDFTAPIGDTGLAYRLIADYSGKDHWRTFGQYRQYIVAPSLSWQGDNTRLLAAYEYQNYTMPFDRGTYLDLNRKNQAYASYGKPIDIPAARRLDEPFNISKGYAHSLQLSGEHKLNANWTLKAGYGYNLNHYSDWQARIMSYDAASRTVTRRIDGTRPSDYSVHNLDLSANGLLEQGENITHKLRIAVQAQDNRLRLGDLYRSKNIAGFSIDHPRYVGDSLIASSGTAVSDADSDQYQRLQTAALLLQDAVYLGEHWIVSGGMRGQYYRSVSGKGRGDAYFRNHSEGFKWLPQLGVEYRAAPAWSLYGNYARSLSPNASRGSRIPGTIAPEEGQSFEMGAKYSGERLGANLALFHIRKNNVMGKVAGEDEYRIIGKSRSQGAEVDVSGQITSQLGIAAHYAYTDTKVLQDAQYPNTVGLPFDSVPKHEGGVTLTYDFGRAVGGSWRAGAGVHYIGSWGVGDNTGNWFKLPAAKVYDAFVSYDTRLGKHPLNLRLNGKNLSNKRYYIASTGSNSTMPFLSIGEPRTLMLSVRLGF